MTQKKNIKLTQRNIKNGNLPRLASHRPGVKTSQRKGAAETQENQNKKKIKMIYDKGRRCGIIVLNDGGWGSC